MDHGFVLNGVIHNNHAYVGLSPAVRSKSFSTQKRNDKYEIVFISFNF